MQYSKENILRIAYGQLTLDELDRAVVAIDGFVKLFGKSWIDNYFRWDEFKRSFQDVIDDPAWLEEHFKVGSLAILDIISYWEDWGLLQSKVGAQKTLKRWKDSVRAQGILSEIFIAANFVRAGTQVELEPKLDTGKRADCRFRFDSDDDWTYVEVSRRGASQTRKAAKDFLQKAARAAARVVPGLLGQVVILRLPSAEGAGEMLAWLDSIKDTGEQRLGDLAVFFTGLPGQGLPGDLDRVAHLVKGATPFSSPYAGDDMNIGIAWLDIRDNMYLKIIKDEREQLPEDKAGIVAIDVSEVIGFKWLPDLAHEVFQAPESSQISALVFFRILHAGEGRRIEGQVLLNPYTKNSLSSRAIILLQEMFPDKKTRRAQ